MIPPPRVLTLPGGEPILHHGPADGPQFLILQPLFEEQNRCRALVASICRRLGARGIGCWLPDLPGTGESMRALETVGWADWQAAVVDAATLIEAETGAAPAGAAIRGGALLDAGLARRWRLSPVTGASLHADLRRVGLTGAAWAGYPLPDAIAATLRGAEAMGEARTLRLAGDDRPCEARIDGPALWRRPEPATDDALAAALADDLAAFAADAGDGRPPASGRRQGPGARKPIVAGPEATPRPHRSGDAPAPTDAHLDPSPPCRRGPIAAGLRAHDGDDPHATRRILWRDGLTLSLDGPADATEGWLLVTGGTQTRTGPHRLYERLAHALAAGGAGVVRFDRPGTGDSAGHDPGFDDGGAMRAAAAALREGFPAVARVTGFGLCDGATALALHGRAAGVDAVVLANPWVVEPDGGLPPAAAIRGHYRDRLRDPCAWWRLLRGGVDLRRLARGLARSTGSARSPLAARLAAGLPDAARIVLADGDNTARAFDAAWRALPARPAAELVRIATPSHSFAGEAAFAALAAAVTRRR